MSRMKGTITPSEYEVLEVMWNTGKEMTASEIVEISKNKTWKSSSVHLLMASLLKKDLVEISGFKKTTKNFARTFKPSISKSDFIINEALEFFHNDLDKFYDVLIEKSSDDVLKRTKAKIEKRLG